MQGGTKHMQVSDMKAVQTGFHLSAEHNLEFFINETNGWEEGCCASFLWSIFCFHGHVCGLLLNMCFAILEKCMKKTFAGGSLPALSLLENHEAFNKTTTTVLSSVPVNKSFVFLCWIKLSNFVWHESICPVIISAMAKQANEKPRTKQKDKIAGCYNVFVHVQLL